MVIVDEIQVYNLTDIVGEQFWLIPPAQAEKEAREWCQRNDAVYGSGTLDGLVQVARASGRCKVLRAED